MPLWCSTASRLADVLRRTERAKDGIDDVAGDASDGVIDMAGAMMSGREGGCVREIGLSAAKQRTTQWD